MNLLALRYFCHVAETESVTASAGFEQNDSSVGAGAGNFIV